MKMLMDEVRFESDNGCKVTLVKKLPGRPGHARRANLASPLLPKTENIKDWFLVLRHTRMLLCRIRGKLRKPGCCLRAAKWRERVRSPSG